MSKRITILGLGNLLLGDDGIGIRVIQELQKKVLPPGIEVMEGAGSFIHYWDVFARSTHIIAVDAMDGGGKSGTVYLLEADQVEQSKSKVVFNHEDDIFTVRDIMKTFGFNPKVWVIGIQPKDISLSLELSKGILQRMPRIVDLVLRQAILVSQSETEGVINH